MGRVMTSLIASASNRYAAWTLALCRKVLRYLVGAAEQGLRLTPAGSESELVIRSDAGFGGLGTKSQSACLMCWAGSATLWRSSRQPTPAMSTCEAEVSAAALSWQVAEGARCMLQEWGVKVDPPVLLVDNQSALRVAYFGGSWRARYFAVRAHRIGQTSKVTYVDIIAENTVDDRILKALRSKIDIASQILAEDPKVWII